MNVDPIRPPLPRETNGGDAKVRKDAASDAAVSRPSERLESAKLPFGMNRARGVSRESSPWNEKIVRTERPLKEARLEKRDAPLSLAARGKQAAADASERPDVQKVATDFSGLLVQQLVREMFESVKEGEGPFGDGPGADIERGIAETAFSQSLAESGMASLKDAIARAVGEHAPPQAAPPSLSDAAPPDLSGTRKELSR